MILMGHSTRLGLFNLLRLCIDDSSLHQVHNSISDWVRITQKSSETQMHNFLDISRAMPRKDKRDSDTGTSSVSNRSRSTPCIDTAESLPNMEVAAAVRRSHACLSRGTKTTANPIISQSFISLHGSKCECFFVSIWLLCALVLPAWIF
jgi:hypothetical protein